MTDVETYHALRDIQRKIKYLRDLNTMGTKTDPVSKAAGLAYDNTYRMLDKLANRLYNEGIKGE